MPPADRLGTGQYTSVAVRFATPAFVPQLALSDERLVLVANEGELQVLQIEAGPIVPWRMPDRWELTHLFPGAARIAVTDFDRTMLLNLSFGSQPLVTPVAVDHATVWSADGARLAVTPRDHEGPCHVVVHDNTGRVIRDLGDPSRYLEARALSPDGRLLAAVASHPLAVDDEEGTHVEHGPTALLLIDLETGEERPLLEAPIHGCAFDAQGHRLAVLTRQPHTAWMLFDTTSGNRLLASQPGDADNDVCLALSPCGRVLATGGETLRLWSTHDGACLRTFPAVGCEVASVAFSPNGQWIATAHMWSNEGSVRVWSVDQLESPSTPLERLASNQCTLSVSSHGEAIATIDGYDNLRIWDPTTGRERGRFECFTDASPCWLTPPSLLLVGSPHATRARLILAIDTQTGHRSAVQEALPFGEVAVASDERHVAFRSQGHVIVVWDAIGDRHVSCIEGPREQHVALAVSAGARFLAALTEKTLHVWAIADHDVPSRWSVTLPPVARTDKQFEPKLKVSFSSADEHVVVMRGLDPAFAMTALAGEPVIPQADDPSRRIDSFRLALNLSAVDVLLDQFDRPVAPCPRMSSTQVAGTLVAGLIDRHLMLFRVEGDARSVPPSRL